jgi:hypothetical protein
MAVKPIATKRKGHLFIYKIIIGDDTNGNRHIRRFRYIQTDLKYKELDACFHKGVEILNLQIDPKPKSVTKKKLPLALCRDKNDNVVNVELLKILKKKGMLKDWNLRGYMPNEEVTMTTDRFFEIWCSVILVGYKDLYGETEMFFKEYTFDILEDIYAGGFGLY